MTIFSNIGAQPRRGIGPQGEFWPGLSEDFALAIGAPAGAATRAPDGEWLPAVGLRRGERESLDESVLSSAGFDLAAIRPTRAEMPPLAERQSLERAGGWGFALSLGLHLVALLGLLTWPTPVAESPPPEAVTVDLVVDVPAPTPTPVVEPPPPPVVEQPPPPPVPETPPPPVVEPPPPPVVEPPPPPVVEPPPPPVVEPPPPPVVEPPPPPSAKPVVTRPPPPTPKPPLAPAKPRPTPTHVPRESAEEAPKPAKPAPAVSSADAAAYQGAVLARIAAGKRYPEAARERAPHGVAVVAFSINAAGQIVGAAISQSAGDPLLDAEALATVHRASPFPPPPAGAPRSFTATLSYRVR